ncbi:MAG: dihydropteroate synthase [Chitinophagales bacterium]
MGIVNITPDSFYDGGKSFSETDAVLQCGKMVDEGAAIIDIGAMSSRPGSSIISSDEELQRLLPVLKLLIKNFQEVVFSIDTLHAKVAAAALEAGAHIINDISAGTYDSSMLGVVAQYKAPMVMMHMQGLPEFMQNDPNYENAVAEIYGYLAERIAAARAAGIKDVIIDPGFGFGKTLAHNFELLRDLQFFNNLNCPILVGLSRKGMITKTLGNSSAEALNGTTVLNTVSLMRGAKILRVHDVKAAKEAIQLINRLNEK